MHLVCSCICTDQFGESLKLYITQSSCLFRQRTSEVKTINREQESTCILCCWYLGSLLSSFIVVYVEGGRVVRVVVQRPSKEQNVGF
jgi:hypothetical protein